MRGVLALDQGSHASRAVVFDETGQECATVRIPIATIRGAHGEIEHDAGEILASLRTAAVEAVRTARRDCSSLEIIAAGLGTQRSTILCCQRDALEPLTPAISWQDRRNAGWIETLAPHEARIRSLTGLPLSAHYGASKLRWCVDQLPAVRAAASSHELLAAPLAAWLVGRLTGTPGCDPANAARTLLWDSSTLDWSAELCALFGIDPHWLPPCLPTRHHYGSFEVDGMAIPLTACTGDQSAVPFAFGLPDPATVYVNIGTGAFIQQPLIARPAEPAPLLGSILCVDETGPLYSIEGTVNGAGSAVAWFAHDSHATEAVLWQELEALPDDTALPLFINGVGGIGSPWWHPGSVAEFIGEGSTVERFAAVIESIAFLIALNVERMHAHHGRLARVVLTGGLSRSAWLCRQLASTLGVSVERCAAEATARGIATLAAPILAGSWRAPIEQRFAAQLLPEVARRFVRFRQLMSGRFG